MTESSVIVKEGILPRIQRISSLGFLWLASLLLILSVIALGLAWIHAFRDGMVPDEWGTYDGNHGPWNHYHKAGDLLGIAITLPLYSFFSSCYSVLIKKSRTGIWLIIISFVYFFLMLCSQFWLID